MTGHQSSHPARTQAGGARRPSAHPRRRWTSRQLRSPGASSRARPARLTHTSRTPPTRTSGYRQAAARPAIAEDQFHQNRGGQARHDAGPAQNQPARRREHDPQRNTHPPEQIHPTLQSPATRQPDHPWERQPTQHTTTPRRQRITPSAPPQRSHRRVHHHQYCTYPSRHARTAPLPPRAPRLDKCREAAEVRKRWLVSLFARRTAPREVAPFVARQLLTMPDPLRSGLAAAPGRLLFSEITGQPAASWLEACDTVAAGRVPLLLLGPVATAFEQAMIEAEGKNTWRLDRYSPCPRAEAGRYLAFLGTLGYQLSGIERAVADNEPYAGESPLGDSLAVGHEPVTPADQDVPATADDVIGETGSGAVGSWPEGTDSGIGHGAG